MKFHIINWSIQLPVTALLSSVLSTNVLLIRMSASEFSWATWSVVIFSFRMLSKVSWFYIIFIFNKSFVIYCFKYLNVCFTFVFYVLINWSYSKFILFKIINRPCLFWMTIMCVHNIYVHTRVSVKIFFPQNQASFAGNDKKLQENIKKNFFNLKKYRAAMTVLF